MDIHRPKPFHGWRELAKEVGVIVLGVLIALVGEQIVEALHWRHAAEVERSALRAEAADNLGVVQNRILLQPCIDRRLNEIGVVFQRHADGQPLGIIGSVGLPLPQEASRGSWSIAVAGQALGHMPHSEQLEFSGAFSNFENWDRIRQDERDAWVRLVRWTNGGRSGRRIERC